MKTKRLIYLAGAWALLSTLNLQPSTVFAQGSLTPLGPPAPTMKSLDQVEPRTAITNLPVFINQSGSYYLTRSFEQAFTSDAVHIATNNVTLDLEGFTIHQTGGMSVITGIRIENAVNVPVKNVTVRNGTVTGFNAAGITCLGLRNCIFENLVVTECSLSGINIQGFGTAAAVGNVVRHCRTCDNSQSGVVFISGTGNVANVIEDCESLNNTTGFSLSAGGNLIVRCRASGNAGNNYTIAIGNREGLITLPATNSVAINGSSGGAGSGNTDPFGNLSY
ncbi:MAG TPA: right-handed parallel beta-helix repeat-containing protein [Candidatus Acidoferrum sp.]|nr:right-handed parallel beta-helix repeat-containing protein [Candidatus Acidoferrum sp.]